jgi:hypothetical protein
MTAMNFIPRSISQHHRARLIAWTLAMLLWTFQALFAAALSPRYERQRRERMSLTWLTQQVKLLIISRANDFVYAPTRRRLCVSYRGCRNSLKSGFVNAMIGVRIKRMLHAKGVIERISALMHALRHIDDFAIVVAYRLRRGLTRRQLHLFALPPAPDTRVVTLAAPDAICVDSS